jgi:hypothetical protein
MKMARKGLPKKYAKMGFKKGWRAYKASKRKRRSPTRKRAPARRRTRAAPKRRVRRVARRKKRARSRGKHISLKKALPIAKVLLEAGGPAGEKIMAGDFNNLEQAINQGIQNVQNGAGGTLSIAATMYVLGFLVPGRLKIGSYSIGIN